MLIGMRKMREGQGSVNYLLVKVLNEVFVDFLRTWRYSLKLFTDLCPRIDFFTFRNV